MNVCEYLFGFFFRMKFTRSSTPKKSKKRSKESEAADEDLESPTRKVIEILGCPVSSILFCKTITITIGSDTPKEDSHIS